MRNFFVFTLFYAIFAVAVLCLSRDNPAMQVVDALTRTSDMLTAFVKYLPFLVGAVVLIFAATKSLGGTRMVKNAAWAFAACVIFSSAFTFMKTSLPYVMPFWADPMFAELDKVLHFGHDPWVWTHSFAAWIPAEWVSVLYFIIWGLPAAFFPFILALTDQNQERVNRYLVMHCVVWIGLGNVLAYAFASAGPIYYDRLEGVMRFDDLANAIVTSGLADTRIGMVQEGLWRVYAEYSQVVGSGISAFPSVHNGVAAMVMFYLIERSRWLAPIGVAFCAAILFCSVYVGWHYAIDGYASIILIGAFWWAQRKWATIKGVFASAVPQTPATSRSENAT